MEDLAFLAPAGGVALAAFLYLRRHAELPAAHAWSVAWIALYVTGLLFTAGAHLPALMPLGMVTSPFWSCYLLRGALAFVGARPSRMWVPLAAADGVAAALAEALGGTAVAMPVAMAYELSALAVAAGAAIRHGRRRDARGSERALGPLLLLLSGVTAVDAGLRTTGHVPVGLLSVWVVASLGLAMLQIAVLVDRVRDRERRLAEEKALLRQVARAATWQDGPDPLEEPVAGMRAQLGARALTVWEPDAGAAGGWRRCAGTPEGEAGAGPGDPPALRTPLASDGRQVGLLTAAWAPGAPQPEDAAARLGAFAEELALALAHRASRAERERQARALEAEGRVREALLDAIPTGILLADGAGRVVRVNRALTAMLGPGEDPERYRGRPAHELLAAVRARHASEEVDAFVGRLLARARAARVDLVPVEIRLAGRIVTVEARSVHGADGSWLGRVWAVHDVTEERLRDERRAQSKRLETLGTLAGGVAHDFNNQLTAILGNARLLLDGAPPDHPDTAALRDLERSAEHCAELTRGLLDFARRSPGCPESVCVERAFHEAARVLQATLPADAVLELQVQPGTPPLRADATHLHRVLQNLLGNARDALGPGGRITLAARPLPDPEGRPARVELRVRDTGAGMSPEVAARAFDPFFTTRDVGQGTGLGLAIVYGVVESHGGRIELETAPGKGTTFRIAWPAAEPAPGPAPEQRTEAPEPAAPARVGGTVLLCEDEPAVRRLAARSLTRRGFRVVVVGDGDAALGALARSEDELAAAVLDLHMPGRTGSEVLAALRARRPGLPALVVTGNPETMGGTALPPDVPVLRKPFRPGELADAVEQLLG